MKELKSSRFTCTLNENLFAQRETCIEWYETMLGLIPKDLRLRVLDLECGHGHVFSYLREEGREAYGLDIDKDSLKYQELKATSLMEMHNLPFRNESFDVILAFELVEHLKEPENALE